MGTEGWVKRSEGYKSDVWSSVTYETTEGGATVDILILSNAKDGWDGTRSASGERARKDTRTASSIRGHTTRSTGRMLLKRRSWAAA